MVKKVIIEGGGQLNMWEKGESGNPKGRPRKIVNQMKMAGYRNYQIKEMIEKVSAMHVDELDELAENKNATVLELGMAKLAKNLIEQGKTDFVDYITPKKTSTTIETVSAIVEELPDDPQEAANAYGRAIL